MGKDNDYQEKRLTTNSDDRSSREMVLFVTKAKIDYKHISDQYP